MNVQKSILLVALCVALTGCGDKDAREAKYLQRGIKLFEQGELQKARLEFKNAAAVKPTDPEINYRIGLIDEAEGDLRNAFTNFLRAEQQDAAFHPAQIKLAQYYLTADELDEAQPRIERALSQDARDAEAHALRGALDLRRGRHAESEQEARRALELDPQNVAAVSVLAGLHVARNDLPRATATVEAGIARNPNKPELQVLKAAVYRKFGNNDKVIEALTALAALQPNDVDVRAKLAEALADAGRLEEAQAAWRGGIAAAPDDWGRKYRFVGFLADRFGLDPAENEVKAYLAAHPDDDRLYFWLAELYVRFRSVDRAVALLEKVADRNKFQPMGLNARNSLARINFSRGDRALAEKLLGMVLEKDPGNRDALYMRAALAFDDGRFQATVSDIRTVLRTSPRETRAMQLMAEALMRQGRLSLARDTLAQMVEIAPDTLDAQVRLAQFDHINHASQRALDALAELTRAHPDLAVAWESSARIAIDTQDWSRAEASAATLETLPGQARTAAFLRGQILEGTNRHDEAIHRFQEVIRADPSAPLSLHALDALVRVSRATGRLAAAAHFIESLPAGAPPDVAIVLAEIQAELGRFAAAEQELDRVLASTSDRPLAYLTRAQLFLRNGQADPAIDLLKKGRAAVPEDTAIAVMLAELYGQRGQVNEEIEIFEDLLARDPFFDLAANNFASLTADYHANNPQALEKARKSVERFQTLDNPALLDTVAWVEYRLNNIPRALSFIAKAGLGQNLPPQIHYHYGAILLAAGQTQHAKEELALALPDAAVSYPGVEEARALLRGLP